jgi:asparagine synthase (glutamine-hydrolysing)
MLTSFWNDPSILVRESNSSLKQPLWYEKIPNQSFANYMMYADFKNYLPDDILAKVDRAAMSVSLETRVPFLDHRVIEFAARLPMNMKIRNGRGKWILRQLLSRYVPESLFERPKMGFSVPLDIWLRGPLRDWANDYLSEDALNAHGLFYSEPIRLAWKEHLSGDRNWQYQLWNILMFQSWIKNQ